MRKLHLVASILLAVGGLNWLLIGIGGFGWNVLEILGSSLARIAYLLVGLSALNEIVIHNNLCRNCEKNSVSSSATS